MNPLARVRAANSHPKALPVTTAFFSRKLCVCFFFIFSARVPFVHSFRYGLLCVRRGVLLTLHDTLVDGAAVSRRVARRKGKFSVSRSSGSCPVSSVL